MGPLANLSDRLAPRSILLRMKPDETSFISQALRVIGVAVAHVIGMTDLHVRTSPLPQRLASRARSRLRALEQMLRRVITLMALGMLGKVKSAPKPRPRVRMVAGPSKPFSRRVPKLPEERAPLMPAYRGGGCSDVDFSSLPKGKPRKPVSIYKLVARIALLQRVLENPEPSARRLATHYARLKKLDASPSLPPEIPFHRASAELALVAGALPTELTRALRLWHDSG